MRKLTAQYIFPLDRPPLQNGVLSVGSDGTILDLAEKSSAGKDDAEVFDGVIVPGFINTHCHLEFSHLHNKIHGSGGIGGFIGALNKMRYAIEEEIIKHASKADQEMAAAGISAVGDVTNTLITLPLKIQSTIYYHTFAEAFGFMPERAGRAFQQAEEICRHYTDSGLECSVVPHAPYSVSPALFSMIARHAESNRTVLTIHNQESRAENEFFSTGGGPVAHHLTNNIGLDISWWTPPGTNSLEYILEKIPPGNRLLLVHNNYTTQNDLDLITRLRTPCETFFVLCPNSNLFIENILPPVRLFLDNGLQVCTGTDSLASNKSLSILEELKTLQQNVEGLSLEDLLLMGCLNGAKALKIDHRYGSLGKGKKPGINLLTGLDYKNMKLLPGSQVRKLA